MQILLAEGWQDCFAFACLVQWVRPECQTGKYFPEQFVFEQSGFVLFSYLRFPVQLGSEQLLICCLLTAEEKCKKSFSC
jgi:hypothetical protein